MWSRRATVAVLDDGNACGVPHDALIRLNADYYTVLGQRLLRLTKPVLHPVALALAALHIARNL